MTDGQAVKTYRPTFKKKCETITFCLLLINVYAFNIIRIHRKQKSNGLVFVYSLTYAQTYYNRSLNELVDFFNSKRFGINPEDKIWVELRGFHKKRKLKNLKITIDIPLRIYIEKFTLVERIKILKLMIYKLSKLIISINKSGYLTLVAKELVFDETIYNRLNKNLISKLITTQSHIVYQPIIFENEELKGKRVMLWYSSNSIPIEYKNPKQKRWGLGVNIYKYAQIDNHWVWTKEHARYLSGLLDAKVSIKGSMMFYNRTDLGNKNKNIDVLIFDITPLTDKKIHKNSIFNPGDVSKFVEEIVKTVSNISLKRNYNFKIYIKHKRRIGVRHSDIYIKYINSLVKQKKIQVLAPEEDLYKIIASSKVIISYPFTSPAIIGQELGIPSIFYSSSLKLPYTPKIYNGTFIQERKNLENFLLNNLGTE